MGKFQFIQTSIQDLYLIEPLVFEDIRGYFFESYNQKVFEEANIKEVFIQDNESRSKKGVLRGLHFQSQYPQGKLVRVIKGTLFDVAVDLRIGSPTFGKWEGFILSEHNKKQLYIPEGFAHGFLVLSDEAVFHYKCTNFYRAEYDSGILWNDTVLGIKWPLEEIKEPILSDKDKRQKKFNEISLPFLYKGV